MATPWFNQRKSAQVAAYFACKHGGEIDILKLVKLIYLSDRKNMERYGYPIIIDRFVSMPHGPVNSMTLNYINGTFDMSEQWEQYISDRAGHSVAATANFGVEDLDELSEAEVESLDMVWTEFGHMSKWQLRDWTHNHCPEWEDPEGSAQPIPHERVFKFLGFENADELGADIKADRGIEELFARLRG